MRLIYNRLAFLCILMLSGSALFAQVKIGGEKASAPHPSAVLELSDTSRGFLLPRLKQEQMVAMKSPANGLLIYNTTVSKIFVYLESLKQWKELLTSPQANLINPEDSSEWVYEPDSSRVYLRRGLAVNDSVFYSPVLGKMNFTDRYVYTNSLGQDFNVDLLGGKFNFKSTASKMDDSVRSAPYTASIVKEVDNSSNTYNDSHSGLLVATTVNYKATQPSSLVQGVNVSSIHAGQDTVYTLSGVDNVATVNGNGYTETVWGLNNTARISANSHNDVNTMFGIRNVVSKNNLSTGRVTGDVFGYQGSLAGLSGKVDGTMYGIFLGNVQNGTTRRNYSMFTSRGLNRFGDSVLVTDNFNTFPRAVFDINSTSAMIMPNGTTAQRPLTNVQGMLRYNSTTNNPEYNDGTNWLGIGDGGEWKLNPANNNIELYRPLAVGDSIFYFSQNRRFVFSDRFAYSNSLGQPDFTADQLGGKFVFKSTASKMNDSASSAPYTSSIINEVDNASNRFNDFHSGLLIATTVNPKSFQTSSQVQGANISTIHAGQDTVYTLSGVDNVATVNGNGYTESVFGLNNAARISSNSRNDVGTMYGMLNSISRSGAATGRITGDVFGYQGSFGGLSGKVDGTIYGIFLGNIQNGTTRRNYGLFTSKGLNRFGDSVLVTDNFASLPRAVFDINSTSAMVLPNGTTAQRPATNVQGMFRYNNTGNNPEFNNGIKWLALNSDTSEWRHNTVNDNIELWRPMPAGDSIFYRSQGHRFIFSDRFTYSNSLGSDFTSDQLGGKFVFKSTASKMTDSASSAAYTSSIINEIDNASNTYNDFHSGLLIATTVNPKSTQTSSQIQGANISTIHAGQDTVFTLSGVDNVATINGNGYTETVWGINNTARISTNSHSNVGTMYGMINNVTRANAATGRITGDVFGYQGSLNGLSGKVDGTMYGIFLGNIQNGTTRRNYGLYTSKGLNRFGDSVLVTDNFNTLPRAVFDINSTSAMVLPNGTTLQRPVTNVQGMFRYNNTGNNPEFNNGVKWVGINTDSSEWVFNSAVNKVNMKRPLALGDSIFYSTQNRHFVFGDRTMYSNSLGQPDFSVDQLGGKFTFKSTASKGQDSAGTAPYSVSIVKEVDNASTTFNDFYSGLLVATTVNPKAFQKPSQVQGVNVSSIHAGKDTVQLLSGVDNAATVNGLGYAETVTGLTNSVRFNSNARNNIGNIYGIQNSITKSAAATGHVNGNVFGYIGQQSGYAGRINGTLYGIYLGNMTDAGARKNYALYTNAGLNRFGDSVLITNTGSILPRAVVDINATSSMIIPTGTTAQRPATGVTGMVRYNSDNGGTLETYNGTTWNGTIRNTQNINVPSIPANGNVSVTVTVPGATLGSVVYVSPSAALPAAVVIAWARVSALNTVEIRFNNVSAPAANPPAQDYYIRVIQ